MNKFLFRARQMKHTSHKEFETLNWLSMTERFNKCISSIVFQYFSDQCSNYLNEVFEIAPENIIQTRGSPQKLKCPSRKTNAGQMVLSYIGLTIWSKIPEILKLRLSPSKMNYFIYFNESLLKMMKNAFYFILKSLFVLKIFKFLY